MTTIKRKRLDDQYMMLKIRCDVCGEKTLTLDIDTYDISNSAKLIKSSGWIIGTQDGVDDFLHICPDCLGKSSDNGILGGTNE